MTNQLPTQIRFLLADSVREEAGGKLTILGLYSGDEVVMQGALPSQLPEGRAEVYLKELAILIIAMDGEGEFQAQIQLYDPNNSPIRQSSPMPVNKVKGSPMNIILPIAPFPVRAFGNHQLAFQLDKKVFKYKFIVRHQDPGMHLPVTPAPVKLKRKTPRSNPKRKIKGT